MIKNIILDVGGILFDDSKEHMEELLNKNCDVIYKKAYSTGFKECLVGNKTVDEFLNDLSLDTDYKDLKYVLKKAHLKESYPLLKENWNYIKGLKDKGYTLYLLTNITKDSYDYINEVLNIKEWFKGGIYSYQVHTIKPNLDIYRLLIDKYQLNLKETVFFDDKEKNVLAARKVGIISIRFQSLEDIKKIVEESC